MRQINQIKIKRRSTSLHSCWISHSARLWSHPGWWRTIWTTSAMPKALIAANRSLQIFKSSGLHRIRNCNWRRENSKLRIWLSVIGSLKSSSNFYSRNQAKSRTQQLMIKPGKSSILPKQERSATRWWRTYMINRLLTYWRPPSCQLLGILDNLQDLRNCHYKYKRTKSWVHAKTMTILRLPVTHQQYLKATNQESA